MLGRSYDKKFHARMKTYVGVTVCDEWRSFMAFRAWWMENQTSGWALDKDLLGDSREYGPSSCVFVPQWLNNFTNLSYANRGESPIGVSWHISIGKYQAYCHHPFGGHESLGYYNCKHKAHLAWKARKLEIAFELKPEMDKIDLRIYPRVVEIIERAK